MFKVRDISLKVNCQLAIKWDIYYNFCSSLISCLFFFLSFLIFQSRNLKLNFKSCCFDRMRTFILEEKGIVEASTQKTFTCSKSTMETLEKRVKYVQG